MEWFKKLFGMGEPPRPRRYPDRKPKPAAEAPKPARQPAPEKREPLSPRGRRLSNEPKIEMPEIPESQETEPRRLEFMQVSFGKLLKEGAVGGPVRRFPDHGITGYTDGTPEELRNIAPTKGSNDWSVFGSDEQFDWKRDYPWLDERGPVAKINKVVKGESYIGIGRIIGRSEEGRHDKSGRFYTEGRFIFIPAKEWSVAAIPQLANALDPEPPNDFALGTMEPKKMSTRILDKKLNKNWFNDEVKDLLIRVVTGKTLSIQDHELSPKDFLETFYYASLCLPENVARQISFGTALPEMRGGLRVGHTARAMGGTDLRKVAGNWKGEDYLQTELVALVEGYVEAIKAGIEQCETPRDVMKMVTALPSDQQEKIKLAILGED